MNSKNIYIIALCIASICLAAGYTFGIIVSSNVDTPTNDINILTTSYEVVDNKLTIFITGSRADKEIFTQSIHVNGNFSPNTSKHLIRIDMLAPNPDSQAPINLDCSITGIGTPEIKVYETVYANRTIIKSEPFKIAGISVPDIFYGYEMKSFKMNGFDINIAQINGSIACDKLEVSAFNQEYNSTATFILTNVNSIVSSSGINLFSCDTISFIDPTRNINVNIGTPLP